MAPPAGRQLFALAFGSRRAMLCRAFAAPGQKEARSDAGSRPLREVSNSAPPRAIPHSRGLPPLGLAIAGAGPRAPLHGAWPGLPHLGRRWQRVHRLRHGLWALLARL